MLTERGENSVNYSTVYRRKMRVEASSSQNYKKICTMYVNNCYE